MIYLIIPPVSDCFMPTLGATQIAGYLKEKRISFRLFDAGAELNYILHQSMRNVLCTAGDLLDDIDDFSYRNVVSALNIFSACNNQFSISTDDFRTDFNWQDVQHTLEFVYADTSIHKKIAELSFISEAETVKEELYCGFSVSYESQVIPTLILCRIMKQLYPHVKICIGGSLLYNYEEEFYQLLYLTELIDYMILGTGEIVFDYLSRGELKTLMQLRDICVIENEGKYIIDTRKMLTNPVVYEPCFSQLNFDFYPTSQKAFPYMIKDRCYYGKCFFCNGDKVSRQSNAKNVEIAFDRILKIATNIGIDNVYIVDAALSPADFKKIGEQTIINNKIHWIANARFERQLMNEELIAQIANNGCVMLRFGLESGSQKMLDIMNKGTEIYVAENILRLNAMHGIKNHVYIMFGYPGESQEERRETLNFLNRNKEFIFSYSISVFQPIPGTKIYEKLVKQITDSTHEYERIIELVYPDEVDYQKLYNDITKVSYILKDYAQTNLQYYSANIFNETESDRKKINKRLIRKDMLDTCLGCDVKTKNNLFVTENGRTKGLFTYIYVDFYKNTMIHLNISDKLLEEYNIYQKQGGECSFRVEELISILDNDEPKKMYNNFSVSELGCDISDEMSIQFIP